MDDGRECVLCIAVCGETVAEKKRRYYYKGRVLFLDKQIKMDLFDDGDIVDFCLDYCDWKRKNKD